MDGTIGYLETLREDLLDAGLHEGRRGGRARPGPPLRDRFSPRWLVAAAAAITLVAAGGVGWLVTRDGAVVERRTAAEPGTAARRAPEAVPGVAADEARLAPVFDADDTSPRGDAAAHPWAQAQVSRVIRTAQLGLVVPRGTFEDRFAEAVDVAEGAGGFVATSTTRERSGEVTMRIPASGFSGTLASLRALGDVDVQTVQGRDVTADYVDLRARLRIAKSRRAVLLDLMDRASSIAQSIRVQNSLDDTQLRVEELQGQMRLLDDRTSLATIRLRIREEGVEPKSEVQTPSLPTAFERSWAGFVGVVAAVIVGIGYVIPVLVIGLLAWFVVARIRRRRRGGAR
ncbi:MAG TPA: DUF4349 domain-containing protein [Actinomycetota bacterium]|nr:DUF4349 domain-containing protein [Actinomycetota bacterium]